MIFLGILAVLTLVMLLLQEYISVETSVLALIGLLAIVPVYSHLNKKYNKSGD
jgi:hypothetical protein